MGVAVAGCYGSGGGGGSGSGGGGIIILCFVRRRRAVCARPLGLSFVIPAKRPIPLPRGLLPWALHVAISMIYIGSWYSLRSSSQNWKRENVENVRVRIVYIQLTTSIELGCKVL